MFLLMYFKMNVFEIGIIDKFVPPQCTVETI